MTVNTANTGAVRVGMDVIFTCTVEGDASVDSYTWYLNGGVIPDESTNMLTISSFDKTNDGDYQCSAENSDLSETVSLKHQTCEEF